MKKIGYICKKSTTDVKIFVGISFHICGKFCYICGKKIFTFVVAFSYIFLHIVGLFTFVVDFYVCDQISLHLWESLHLMV